MADDRDTAQYKTPCRLIWMPPGMEEPVTTKLSLPCGSTLQAFGVGDVERAIGSGGDAVNGKKPGRQGRAFNGDIDITVAGHCGDQAGGSDFADANIDIVTDVEVSLARPNSR